MYEGADNGLYRMFVRPSWMTAWFVRKAIYRLMKGGDPVSVRWYRWLFGGNEARGLAEIRDMARYCAAKGAQFSVVLMPSGAAYSARGYELADVYERVAEFLSGEAIPVLSPIDAFASDPGRYLDETDHFFAAGNERIAELIAGLVVADDHVAAPIRSLSTAGSASEATRLPAVPSQ
jgi:hypothetical protein